MPIHNYPFTTYASISDVPAAEWESLRNENDLASDRRLIATIEQQLADQCRCWPLIAHDRTGRPVAIAALALFTIDPRETMSPFVRKTLGYFRHSFPDFLKFRVLFCGLPLPPGDNQLRIAPGIDPTKILASLQQTMHEIARDHHAKLIVIKEFPDDAAHSPGLPRAMTRGAPGGGRGEGREPAIPANATALPAAVCFEHLDFIRGSIPPTYTLRRMFTDLNAYRTELRARYRGHLDDSLRRLNEAGYRVEHVYGNDIASNYNDQLHTLYLAGWQKAEHKLEKFSPQFFRELGKNFGNEACLTLIRDDQNQVHAWCISLTTAHQFHALCGGAEQLPNLRSELYFNLFYAVLDLAFRTGCKSIHFGQTSDIFKLRLGCESTPLNFFARGTSPLIHFGLSLFRKSIFPAIPAIEPVKVFREGPPQQHKKGQIISAPVHLPMPAPNIEAA